MLQEVGQTRYIFRIVQAASIRCHCKACLIRSRVMHSYSVHAIAKLVVAEISVIGLWLKNVAGQGANRRESNAKTNTCHVPHLGRKNGAEEGKYCTIESRVVNSGKLWRTLWQVTVSHCMNCMYTTDEPEALLG